LQLKKKKYSEVMVQCNLPFDKTNIEMDMESDVLESFVCEPEEQKTELADNNPSDLLTFEADRVEESDRLSNDDAADVAFIRNILSVNDADNDDMQGDENEKSIKFVMPDFNVRSDNSTIMQLDGSEDLEDDSRGPMPTKIRKIENPSPHDPEGLSPRKDFSIAGLLSPPEQQQQPHPPQQPHQVRPENPASSQPQMTMQRLMSSQPQASGSSQMTSQSQMSSRLSQFPTIPTMGGLGLSKTSSPQMMSFGNVSTTAQPSVFIQHLSTPEMATSFAENFQQTTGRTLQYVTSVNNFQELASFPTFQQHTLHLNSPPSMFQPIGASFQSYLPQQFSYISPQSIIVSPQSGFINFGSGQASAGSPMLFNPQSYAAYAGGANATAQFLQPHPPPPVSTQRLYQQQQQHIMLPPTSYAESGSGPSRLPVSSSVSSSQKKVARVQPQPWAKKAERPSTSQSSQRRMDPIKALSSMASHPMMANASPDLNPNRLSIVHGSDHFSRERNQQSLSEASSSNNDEVVFLSQTLKSPPSHQHHSPSKECRRGFKSDLERQRSVGTQAKLGGPLKIMTPRPWKGTDDYESFRRIPLPLGSGNLSSGVSVQSSANSSLAGSRPSSTFSFSEIPKPASPEVTETTTTMTLSSGIKLTNQKSSSSDSIKIVMQKDSDNTSFKIHEMLIKESVVGSGEVDPQTALQVLNKVKAKVSRRARARREAAMLVPLNTAGNFHHTQDQFVNEQEVPHDEEVVVKEEQVITFSYFFGVLL
jgi:hypothetical protein